MEQTISSDFIRGHIDTIILRSLFSGSKHAFEIAAFIEEKSGNKYEVKQATLYSALKRLEKQKYVKPFWNDAPSGGRRRYFEITPAGKAFADKNLSEWDYSRDVIDQLVDEVPKNLVHEAGVVLPGKSDAKKREGKIDIPPTEPIKQTDEVPKQTEQKQTFVYIREEPKKPITQNEEPRKNEEICDPALEKILNSPQDEINYREILNNLYERNVKKHTDEPPATVAEAEPERTVSKISDPIETERPEHASTFRKESVFDKDFRIKSRNTGKTDFTDLLEKADAEGFKIRISTGKNEKISGKILINKINLCSALSVFLIFLLECLLCLLIYKNDRLFSGWVYIGAILAAAILPVSQIVLYMRTPNKTISVFNKNLLYTVLIILFNVLLIIIAVALLTNTDFTSRGEIATKIVMPVLIVFDAFLYFLFRNICANMNGFITK